MTPPDEFSRQIKIKAARMLRAQHAPLRSIYLGFGVTGIIGWSVAAPTFLGALIGLWLDKHYPGSHSWTLALLVAGLCVGCFLAWNWVEGEDKAMHTPPDEPGTEEERNDE